MRDNRRLLTEDGDGEAGQRLVKVIETLPRDGALDSCPTRHRLRLADPTLDSGVVAFTRVGFVTPGLVGPAHGRLSEMRDGGRSTLGQYLVSQGTDLTRSARARRMTRLAALNRYARRAQASRGFPRLLQTSDGAI